MDIITKRATFFQNEHNLPLNHLSITIPVIRRLKKVDPNEDLASIRDNLEANYETKQTRIPALDPHWIQKSRSYHLYQPYLVEVSPEENACFLEENRLFLQSIQFLLSCSYQQFWCYILYEERVKVILDSFIMNAVPWYELYHLKGEHKELYCEIFDKVARVYCRMLKDKESEMEYMSKAYISNLLLQNNIITFPHVTQLILLYDETNGMLIAQLLNSCYNYKDKFLEDMEKMFEHVKSAFDSIQNQLLQPKAGQCAFYIKPRPAIFDPNWYDDLILYMLDIAATLRAFVKNFRRGLKAAISQQLPMHVARFYNKTFPVIYQMLECQGDVSKNWMKFELRAYEHLALARMEFVNLFQRFVGYYVDNILLHRHEFDEEQTFENYLDLITNIMEEEYFLFDYHNASEIKVQFEVITLNHPNLDQTRMEYLAKCLGNLPDVEALLRKHSGHYCDTTSSEENVEPDFNEIEEVQEKTTEKQIADEEIEKRILEIMEALPHLGDSYILECLEYYKFSTTDVISAILDGTVPHHAIMNLPHAIRVPPELPEPQKQPLLAYKGKKPTYKDAKDMLNDKTDVSAKVRNFILQASNSTCDTYDDEYDDRDEDDGASIAAYNKRMRDRMAEEESDPYKYMHNRFDGLEVVSDPSNSSDEETTADTTRTSKGGKMAGGGTASRRAGEAPAAASGRQNKGGYRKPDFCENPEVARERWAESRRGGGPSRDVTGRPRGEGQDAKTQQNRDKKNTNKSSRSNHSRKTGAAFKRNRGMVP